MANPKNYPKHLEEAGFKFVERMSPTSNKLPVRQASASSTVPSSSGRMSGHQFGQVMHNINNAIATASPEVFKQGNLWYPKAHEIADVISKGDVEKGAGVIAALSSAGGEWERNVRDAEHFVRHGVPMEGSKANADQITAATKIREGEHYRTVLPKGLKTYNFAELIANPKDEHAVVVDTHAADIAGGLKMPWKGADRGLGSLGRYNTIADATRTVAERRGMLPSEAQAAAWVSWKAQAGRRGVAATDMIRRGSGRGGRPA
jgi:hypothetical protein